MRNDPQQIITASICVVTFGTICYALYKRWARNGSQKLNTKGPPRLTLDPASDVSVVVTKSDWEAAYIRLCQDLQRFKVLGFDCEWVSSSQDGRHPVSLLQLAAPSGFCVLIRLSVLRLRPATLLTLLADKSILKVGVACLDDAKKLALDHQLITRGCIDLRHLAARSRITNCRGYGLKDLTASVLGVSMDKEDRVRRSNWEQELTEKQIHYAALDALVAVHIFMALIGRKLPDLLTRWGSDSRDDDSGCDDLWQRALSVCQGIVDVGFSLKTLQNPKTAGSSPRRYGQPDKIGQPEKVCRAYVPRKKPLYQNCRLLAPDGQILATIDQKKAEWYMENDLGEKHSDDPLTVRLKFEPAGRPLEVNSYYTQDKENICAVCGSDGNTIRKSIVPHEYRKYFPSVMKNHKSHDVILLCVTCHKLSSYCDSSLRLHLAQECDAPIGTEAGVKCHLDPRLAKVRSAAKALLNKSAKIPECRREELSQIVKCHFMVDTLDDVLLQGAIDTDIRVANDAFRPHGQAVVEHVIGHGGLIGFEKIWRQHFLDSLKPRHLPALWSVDHCHEQLAEMDRDLRGVIASQTTLRTNGAATTTAEQREERPQQNNTHDETNSSSENSHTNKDNKTNTADNTHKNNVRKTNTTS